LAAACACRRWRLYFLQLRSFGGKKESGIPFIFLFGGRDCLVIPAF